jgi:mobilization protein NikA
MTSVNVDEEKRRRYGPAPLSDDEKRNVSVSSRLNKAEATQLDRLRSTTGMQRGEYLRCAALHLLPPPPRTVPAINDQAYRELGKLAGNLNQLQKSINSGQVHDCPVELVIELIQKVDLLRFALLGITEPDTKSDV